MTFTPHLINLDLDLELIREIPVSARAVFDTWTDLVIEPSERLVWTSALTVGYRPQANAMPFTVVLELADNRNGGCTYRVIAVHQDPAGAKQHAAMGFTEGWGIVVDQIVEHLQRT